MKKKIFVLSLIPLMLFGALIPIAKEYQRKVEIGPDNAVYGNESVADFNAPDIYRKHNAAASATGIKIHYHNENADCDECALWIWCAGVNGAEFLPTKVSEDKKDMEVAFNFTGEYASFAKKKSISFIVKKVGTWVGQSENVEILYSEYTPDANGITEIFVIPGEGDAVEVYKTEDETKMSRYQLATFTDWKTIKVIATDVPSTYRLYALTSNYMKISSTATRDDLNRYLIREGATPQCTDVKYNGIPSKQFEIKLNFTAKVNVQYYLEGVFPGYESYTKTKYVSFTDLYETERFKTYYTYTGDDLGATYKGNSTTFKVWAPTAARVRVLLYSSGTPEDLIEYDKTASDEVFGYNMVFKPGGIWELTITNKNLHGWYYRYYVVNSLGKIETTDPYAKACGVDGSRSMIVDFNKTNPANWNDIPTKWDGVSGFDITHPNDLSIYETHIRDLTMDETWEGNQERGTYSAFVEKGTTYTKDGVTVKTGFDHLEELGVKAIQLEPVFDFDNLESVGERSYNWGYNPLNYNCVDGSYATNPYDGASRILEYKKLVQAFANNENKTRIIMDVVYNHVASAPASCFNKLMPKYYFRFNEAGNYFNGSGCGNEVKTEAPMMSKYIVDSLCFWAKEYKIKGFRFDLMGLIDFQTIKKAAQELYKIDPDIYLYGEGWTGDGSDAHIDNHEPGDPYYGNWGANTWTIYHELKKQGNMCYVGAFNDAGRNALKGGNSSDNLGEFYGFICQGANDVGNKSSAVAEMMVGYHAGQDENVKDPNMCINYASCHDNYALFDQLGYTIGQNGQNQYYPGIVCAASIACECSIMFSNGVAFIQGGEELFRTKEVSAEDLELYGNDATLVVNGKTISHNSYRLSDYTNAYRWDRKIKVGNVETTDYVNELIKAIHTRNNLKKYDKEYLASHSPFSSSSNINVWNQGDRSTCIGMKNDQYFFFLAGCNDDPISFGAIEDSGGGFNKQVFCSNPKDGGFSHPSTGYIKLGWATCVCLTHN